MTPNPNMQEPKEDPENDLELEDEEYQEEPTEDIEDDLELEDQDLEPEDIEDHEDDGMGDWNELDIDEDVP